MKLYPHQIEALELTKGKNKVAYYYDMGLGKTFIGSKKMEEIGFPVNLVICQKSKVKDWIDHFDDNYEATVDDLTTKRGLEHFLNSFGSFNKGQLIGVINYDLIFRRPDLLKLANFTLLLDESSLITNKTAKRSKFALKLDAKNVILLSGTPTAGKYENLWSQLQLLGWSISEDMFWKSYVEYDWIETEDGYWEKKIKGYKNIDHLKKRLYQHGAIFKKTEEVIDLPEKIEQMIYVDPSNEYKKFVKNSYVVVRDKELIGQNVLTKILYERELCGQYNQDKLDAFKDLIESTEDRLIVFYNYTEEMLRMTRICMELKRPTSYVNGSIKDLSSYEDYDNSVTFVQYQAGAYGLNLQKANKMIYFTLPLGLGSCDLWEQSKKRIHRIGQDKTCFYYYLLVRDSIEIWNLELLKTGKELTDDLFKQRE